MVEILSEALQSNVYVYIERERENGKKKNNSNDYNRIPGAAGGGGRKRAVPALSVNTLRGGRKGDPTHKVVGETLGSEGLEYRCVVKDGFQKTSRY